MGRAQLDVRSVVAARGCRRCGRRANKRRLSTRNAPPKRGIKCGNGRIQTAQSFERQGADRQPLVTAGAGGGYLPIGALPTGYLPTGAGAGGGGSLRGRSAAAATLSIAKDAASAVRIFSMKPP